MRSSGILLNISSLPNKYGIGGFGEETEVFSEFIKNCDCKWWQILPITKIGLGNSPYSGESAFAGNYLYIDADKLVKQRLIQPSDAEEAYYSGQPYTVDYDYVKKSKRKLIRKAYDSIIENDNAELEIYLSRNREWLLDYAVYMTLKELNNYKPWFEWEDKYKYRNRGAIAELIDKESYRINYFVCEQYLFDMQWKEAKTKINAKGIGIIGDMPIYVSYDSADVWSCPENYQLNEDLLPTKIAGVPPDYFCEKGQLWGNPIYNYDKMKRDNYDWFVKRIGRMFELYDKLRIDHFRAFDRYWAVDYGSADAISGEWVKGAGKPLFDAVKEKYPNADIIAEDLGIIDDGVNKLRTDIGLCGMKVMQFAFDGDNSSHLLHNFTKDCVAYTGTHDNNTTFGWLYEISPDTRAKLYDYIGVSGELEGGYNSKQIWACIRALLTSVADTVIIPYQDLCGWGNDTRMNVPGRAEGNWILRITEDSISGVRQDKLRRLNYLSARN